MKAHSFDPLSFLGGTVFTALGLAGAAGVLDDLDRLRLGWPLLLVLFGVLLIASTVRGHGDDPVPTGPEDGLGADDAEIEPDVAGPAPDDGE